MKFFQPGKPAFEYRHVLTGYEKSNQRSDNSILLITVNLEQLSGSLPRSNPNSRTTSCESQNSSKVQNEEIFKGKNEAENDKFTPLSRNGHSRTSSGASGYSSSNVSLNKSEAILPGIKNFMLSEINFRLRHFLNIK